MTTPATSNLPGNRAVLGRASGGAWETLDEGVSRFGGTTVRGGRGWEWLAELPELEGVVEVMADVYLSG
jgi:hypothetical protein